MKNKYLFSLFTILLLITNISLAQNKHALLVGIADYKHDWSSLHADNDVELLRNTLIKRGFDDSNIKTLVNDEANKQNVITEFENLIEKVNLGDRVFILFSAHGQVIEDVNLNAIITKDETDNLDETIVLYDSPYIEDGSSLLVNDKNYNGDKHLVDDELNFYLTQIRNKIGSSGYVFLVVDACFSGTIEKDNGQQPKGSNNIVVFSNNFQQVEITEQFEEFKQNKNTAPLIVFSSTLVNQRIAEMPFEIHTEFDTNAKIFGVLSYSLYYCFIEESYKNFNLNELYQSIEENCPYEDVLPYSNHKNLPSIKIKDFFE